MLFNDLRLPGRLFDARRLAKLAHPRTVGTLAKDVVGSRLLSSLSARFLFLDVHLASHSTDLGVPVSVLSHLLRVHRALDVLQSLQKLLVFPRHLLLFFLPIDRVATLEVCEHITTVARLVPANAEGRG